MSGRRRDVAIEDARLFGQGSCIFEIGAGLVLEGETHWLTGSWMPQGLHDPRADRRSPAPRSSCSRSTAAAWRSTARGTPGARSATCCAASSRPRRPTRCSPQNGFEGLELTDNGAVRRRSPALAGLPAVHAYHLRPRGVSKANAVAAHQRMRGYAPEDCIAVGDSREDLGVAGTVGGFFLVANALERDPALADSLAGHPNVTVTEGAHGEGVYEAIVGTLAQRL